jgi:TetR/AcrR family transcriptional regulator, cholesterol catabolism regulator
MPMKDDQTARPTRSKKRNREADVMDAAIEVFAQKGYPAASIQDVADRVGVLKGSLYYYIESKEDLLFRIVDDVHEQSTEILRSVQELDVPTIEVLRTYIERHVEWYLKNVKEVTVFFREWRHLTGDRLRIAKERRRGYEQIFRELIEAAQRDGDIGAGIDPKYASFYVLAAVNAVPDWYRPRGSDSPRAVAETYADMTVGLLTGTRRRGARVASRAA